MVEQRNLVDEIKKLKEERGALILAHNYQRPEVQDIADFVGDSLELSMKAVKAEADVIVFCGVDFMAEQAAVMNPDKLILHPEPSSICPMAQMLTPEVVREYRERYPDAPLVLYVNSTADVKAMADYIVTSANAARLISRLDAKLVLFGPDRNLAEYVSEVCGKKVLPVPEHGHCPVHVVFTEEHIREAREEHPGAKIIAHPECVGVVRRRADFVGSTSQMVRAVSSLGSKEVVVGTEVGIIHRLRKEYPDRVFYPLSEDAVCVNMKKITLESILRSLRDGVHEVKVPEEIAAKVREAVERTFKVLGSS